MSNEKQSDEEYNVTPQEIHSKITRDENGSYNGLDSEYKAMEEYAKLKTAQLEADNAELVSALVDLKRECDTIHCDDPNWVLTNDLAQYFIQKHAAK